jgi:hypothetical protein
MFIARPRPASDGMATWKMISTFFIKRWVSKTGTLSSFLLTYPVEELGVESLALCIIFIEGTKILLNTGSKYVKLVIINPDLF